MFADVAFILWCVMLGYGLVVYHFKYEELIAWYVRLKMECGNSKTLSALLNFLG